MKRLICCLFICFGFVGCRERELMTGVPAKIVEIQEEIQTSFYENVSEYGILKLETIDESLLAEILKIKVYKGMIYIMSGRPRANLSVFTKEGKFVARIGRQGRGPQEYTALYNFEIDPIREELLLLDQQGQKILIYDIHRNFRREIKILSHPECVGRLPNGNLVLSHVGPQLRLNDNHVIAICDENGQVQERHLKNETETSIFLSSRNMMNATKDGSLTIMPQYHNMIYHITDDGITADAGFKIPGATITIKSFDRQFIDTNDFLGELDGKNYMSGTHIETGKYTFFYNRGLMEMEHIFYNKITGKSLRAIHPLFGNSVFIDDDEYCWASIDEVRLTTIENGNDELTKIFLEAFDNYENVPLIYYKLKI